LVATRFASWWLPRFSIFPNPAATIFRHQCRN